MRREDQPAVRLYPLVDRFAFSNLSVSQDNIALDYVLVRTIIVASPEAFTAAAIRPGCRFAVGIRNSHDKSMRLGLTIGARVLVCMNMAFTATSNRFLAKHSKRFLLVDAISVGVERMQRNFEPMRRQVETWRAQQLPSATAKLIIYRAFIGCGVC